MVLFTACTGDPHSAGPDESRADGDSAAVCAEGEYEAWLDGYVDDLRDLGFPLSEEGLAQAEELAESAPCSAGDDAYVEWLQTWSQVWGSHQDDYDQAVRDFENTAPARRDYDAFVEELKIEPAEKRTLRGFLAAAPESAGAEGYGLWLDIYGDMYRSGFSGIQEGSRGFHESPGEFNAAGEQHLEILKDARPEADEDGAFALWFDTYATYYERATRPSSDPGIDEREADYLGRLEAVRPASAGERDYLAWFETYANQFERAAQSAVGLEEIEEHEDAYLAELESVLFAEGGGERAYAAWFEHFTELVSEAADADTDLSAEETDGLSRFLSVKPCGATAENRETYDDVAARAADLGTEVADYIDLAEPEECSSR